MRKQPPYDMDEKTLENLAELICGSGEGFTTPGIHRNWGDLCRFFERADVGQSPAWSDRWARASVLPIPGGGVRHIDRRRAATVDMLRTSLSIKLLTLADLRPRSAPPAKDPKEGPVVPLLFQRILLRLVDDIEFGGDYARQAKVLAALNGVLLAERLEVVRLDDGGHEIRRLSPREWKQRRDALVGSPCTDSGDLGSTGAQSVESSSAVAGKRVGANREDERDSGRSDVKTLDLPPRARWQDVTITLLSGNRARIAVGSVSEILTLADMGFVDRRGSGQPTVHWEVLRAMARSGGRLKAENTADLKQTVYELRKRLKRVIPIKSDPFYDYEAQGAYVARFNIVDETAGGPSPSKSPADSPR